MVKRPTPQAIEYTEQSQPAVHDENYLKLRLDCQRLHQNVLNFLQGTRNVIIKEEGEYVEAWEQVGVPFANPIGIQAILSFVVSVINPHTILGNTDQKTLNRMLTGMESGFIEDLTINYVEWGIDPNNRARIKDTIMYMVHLVLTRTLDNLERAGLDQGSSVKKFSGLFEGKDAKRYM